MVNASRIRLSVVALATLLVFSATLSYGAIMVDPATVTFTSPQQTATIRLTTADGAPIPGKDIRDWQFLASGHDYKHMLRVTKADGALTVGLSNTIDTGSYDLRIKTKEGAGVVEVLVPLSDVPDIVEKTAALTGESEKKVAMRMGLTTSTGHAETQIDLPSVYYEGQTLELAMPATAGHTCTWFMNGDLVAEGPGQSKLSYTFRTPGEYVLNYIETEKGKTGVVARATAHTRVVPMPGIPIEVQAGVEAAFAAPAGYRQHVWTIDSQQVSTEPNLTHSFSVPGVHTVECLSTSPDNGPAQGFLRTRYITTVTAK